MQHLHEPCVLIDSAELKITAEAPAVGRAVVSFTGIGHQLGSIQKEEFVRSLHNLHEENAAFYVIDKNRSWYNATHESIRTAMAPALAPFQEVITLGNSMGGFGAIYFAALFPACRASIAFSPHFSVAPGIGPRRDRRSRKFRDRIKSWPVPHALQHASDSICYFLFYGSKDMRDRRHAELFLNPSRKVFRKKPRNMHIFLVEGCGHEIAAFLKTRNCLRPLLDGILHQNFCEQDIGRLFKSSGIRFHYNFVPFSFRAFLP